MDAGDWAEFSGEAAVVVATLVVSAVQATKT